MRATQHAARLRRSVVLGVLALAAAAAPNAAMAATGSLSDPSIVANFDLAGAQQPENLALGPGGTEDVTFNLSRTVGQVGQDGSVITLATLPQDAAGDALVSGIVRLGDGSLLVDYNAGSQSGIWRIPAGGGSAAQLVALPDAGWLNGLAIDASGQTLYATDSTKGLVWRISLATGQADIWAQGTELAPSASVDKGANGIRVQGDAVYVSNTAQGTLLRFPVGSDGTAGEVSTVASGVTGIDDFGFTGDGRIVAAQNPISEVALIDPDDGTVQSALTAADGLSNPTSVAVRDAHVYITSGAYLTRTDPNLMEATLG
jgi:hypothetical protein